MEASKHLQRLQRGPESTKIAAQACVNRRSVYRKRNFPPSDERSFSLKLNPRIPPRVQEDRKMGQPAAC